jgi:16S rRNA (cytidine1402-2'-O)-methyltransferase
MSETLPDLPILNRTTVPPEGLVLVPTPIGNLGDVTIRAIATLKAADLVLCEDTRVTARLLAAYGIKVSVAPLHDHNEDQRIPALLDRLRGGQRIALVSDAGTPLVSDPGYRLVRAALEAGLPVSALPGPNAALTALTLSGLPPHPFLFLGFPPRGGARLAAFAQLRAAERAGLAATMIWYEAPSRVGETLADLLSAFGDRPAVLARELTKHFEETIRAPLSELAARFAEVPPRGEVCLLIGPAPAALEDADDLDARLRAALAGATLKQAVADVTAATGLPRKQVYARALALAAE